MEADTTQPPLPPDPPQDQPGKTAPVPEYITAFLHAVDILIGYGRHLLDTVHRRASTPTFPAIAAGFGTANISTILAHLNRGILRAGSAAAASCSRAPQPARDIKMRGPPHPHSRDTSSHQQTPKPSATSGPGQPGAKPRSHACRRPPGSDDPEFFMPTQEEFDLQVRRRAVGRTIAEICGDLAVVPGLCTPACWNGLFEPAMHYFGGKVATVMQEKLIRPRAGVHSGAEQRSRTAPGKENGCD